MADKEDFDYDDQFGGADGDEDIGDDVDDGEGEGSDAEGDGANDGEGEPSEGDDGQEVEGEGDNEDEEGKAKRGALTLDGVEVEGDDEEEDDVTHYQSINERLKRSTVASGTSKYITKYEKARVIGVRAKQLEDGAPALVDTTGMVSVVAIAEKELAKGKCPLTVNRPYPNGKTISVPVSQLIDVIAMI